MYKRRHSLVRGCVSRRSLSLGCIDSDRCRVIASTLLTVSIDGTTTVVSERRPLMQPRRCFFPIFLTARRACSRARERILLWKVEVSRLIIWPRTWKRDLIVRRQRADSSRSVLRQRELFRENFRDRATRLSLSSHIDN